MLGRWFGGGWVAAGCVLAWSLSSVAAEPSGEAKERRFRFVYQTTVTKLAPGQVARLWIPLPPSLPEQQVRLVRQRVPAGAAAMPEVEQPNGNQIFFAEAKASDSGEILAEFTYDIVRREIRRATPAKSAPAPLTADERKFFLTPDRRGPITGRPLELLADVRLPRDPFAMARVLYDRVDAHVKYDKSRPGFGTGDVNWVCDSRYGNCCDFHALFMALARSQGIPARFEIGFPLPDERGAGEIGGYHCWAFFHEAARGWTPVDISEADKHPELNDYYFGNLTENRVTFSFGRDIELIPRQAGEPLNYFVYPYVEVDGQIWPKDRVVNRFSYRDADQIGN